MVALLLVLLHLYIGARLLPPLPAPAAFAGAVALAALLVLLLAAIARFGRRDRLGWAGLVGIGYFSSLFVLTLLRDALLIVWHGVAALGAPAPGAGWAALSAAAVPLLAMAASAVGFLNARRRPAVREVDVPIDGLAPALDGFRIVQLSDLHVGATIERGFVDDVVDAANALGADLAVITGDIVDGSVRALAPHTAPLGRLAARHGVFAVTGNHEYYSGAAAWIDEFTRLGLTVLVNRHVVIDHRGAPLVVAGVPDASGHRFDAAHRSDPARALAGAPDGALALLLAHQPRQVDGAAAAGVALQLSGHTHGGQFMPWNWFVPLQQPYTAGLYRHGPTWLYVSRGTGYWGPPKRLGAPSEITLVRLVAVRART